MASVDKFTPFDLTGHRKRKWQHWIPVIGIWFFLKDAPDIKDDSYVQWNGAYAGVSLVGLVCLIVYVVKSVL